jgi:hypothetical protein
MDIKHGRVPKDITDFLLEYTDRLKGLKSLSSKFLSSLIPGLYNLYQENHPYIILLCRMF